MDILGQRLRAERERLGLSQTAFWGIGGGQKRAQINYEAGERQPDAAYLAAIAAAGADVLYILTGQRQGEPVSPVSPVQLDPDTRTAIEMAGDELHRQRKTVSGKRLLELVDGARRYIRQARELPGTGTHARNTEKSST